MKNSEIKKIKSYASNGIRTRNPCGLKLRNTCVIGCAKKTAEHVFKHVRTVHVVLIVFILCSTDSRNTSIGISCKPIHLFTEEMPCSSALTYTGISCVKQTLPILKVDFHSKSKKLHMYLYFIAT